MQVSYRTMLALSFLLMSACNPEFKDSPQTAVTSEKAKSISTKNLEDFVQVQVQPKAEAEKYIVYFSWPQLETEKSLRIRLDQTLTVVKGSQTDFNHEVTHNQTLTYTFEVIGQNSKVEKTFSKQIKIPRDFVIRDGQSEFFENTKVNVNRIFINEKPMRTNGFNIELIANELHSQNGIIETFSEGQQSAVDTDGKSGGELSLKINSATGNLKIIMRGENGGNGSKGENYPGRAGTGSPAGNGNLQCECSGIRCLQFFKPAEPNQNHILAQSCSCNSYGSDGGRGATGAQGKKGHKGADGGSSGILKVSIENGSEFDLQTFAISGQAGKPGVGGDGQLGGLGGPGRSGEQRDCRGSSGPEGDQGPRGEVGDAGVEGAKGSICVYIASESKNDCY